jgi:two-component system response regulator FlrC
MNEPVLLVEDDAALRGALAETLSLADYQVFEAEDGSAALDVLAANDVAAVISDYQMEPMNGSQLLNRLRHERPDLPFVLMTAYGTIQHAIDTIRDGASDYVVKPFDAPTLLDKLAHVIARRQSSHEMIAVDPATRRVLSFAERVASTDATVLLTGESGSGKEVFARYIHQHSTRSEGPFIALNCAAIPENMLEAILFGHEKGAFTGAHVARPGKFEQAQGGTLLLDEISEIDLGLQAKLLRVLQEREVERVGAQDCVKLDVRVLATSNRDLAETVRRGKFREDLYYRLSVFPLQLPPLRDRPADILPLAGHFLALACDKHRDVPRISADASQALLEYSWPGNVRELHNLVERALILNPGGQINAADLMFEATDLCANGPSLDRKDGPAEADDTALRSNLKNVEGQLVLDALAQADGCRKTAAEILGVSPRTLRYKLARLRDTGVSIPGQRGARG